MNKKWNKCTGCLNLTKLNKLPSYTDDTVWLCDECIERFKIPVQNIVAIAKSTEIDLTKFIAKFGI